MSRDFDALAPLERYSAASERAADQVIRAYSTSFGAATRLLGPRHRRHVRNIYALVRVADELVDGVAAEAHLPSIEQLARLNALETETNNAMRTGYSSNPIVHAFACTARTSGIDAGLTGPFFASMRTDLEPVSITGRATEPARTSAPETLVASGTGVVSATGHRFDDDAHASYVYGSAEVVGLMCLRVFLREETVNDQQRQQLEHGARSLGAAFQNVNFLRDLADDTERLDRSYLSTDDVITDDCKADWVATIRGQLDAARDVLPLLPRDARIAVDTARRLFSKLTDRIDQRTVTQLMGQRVRVPLPVKLALIARAIGSRGSA
ncbi:phytoene/squalene synthase family protein [Microbacterium sp. YY-03]|uniref:phytoene/squalene synthase family protein n=1 Tax=Microbacterium sp. YY-03 TaxID=3421636 RepID=UPI003D17BACE